MNDDKNYAIVRTSGKQYRVTVGERLRVDKLPDELGSTVELDQVLLLSRGGKISVGVPLVKGAKVRAKVAGHGRGAKIVVFKYKPKIRYRKKTGHRQPYTDLNIEKITAGRTKTPTAPKAQLTEKSEGK